MMISNDYFPERNYIFVLEEKSKKREEKKDENIWAELIWEQTSMLNGIWANQIEILCIDEHVF